MAILPLVSDDAPITLPKSKTLLLIAGVFLILIFLAFGRSLFQGFAPLDDDLLITHNLAVRGITPENLRSVFTTFDPELYIPLTFVSYQVNYLIGGLHPFIYHLTNILLHAGNALLVSWLLLLLTGKWGLSLFAGLLFAVHPLNTEAVVWLASRKDLLSTALFLGAWIAYITYRKRGRNPYVLSVVLFLFALLSKIMAVSLPVALLLTDHFIERRPWNKAMIIDKLPYVLLSAIFLGIALFGKERIVAEHSTYSVALIAAKSIAFYLQKFLLPVHLGVFYPHQGGISLLLPAFFIPALLTILIVGGIAATWRRIPWFAFGALVFLITLSPTFLNSQKSGEIYFASDRYPYLPSVGLLFLIVMGITQCMRDRRAPLMARAGAGALIAILAVLSFSQTKIWDSAETLFGNTLRLYPQSIAARISLATMAKNTGKYDQAIKLLRDGLGYGDDVLLRMGLGTVYAKMGRVEDARDQFLQARALDSKNPEPLVALGVLDEYEKNIPAAIENYRTAVMMDSSYVSARNKLGTLLMEEGNLTAAEEQFRAALEWNPNAEGVHYNLSLILDVQGKPDEALAHLEKANELLPDDPQIMLALAEHLTAKDSERARELLGRIFRRDPQNPDAQSLMKELQY